MSPLEQVFTEQVASCLSVRGITIEDDNLMARIVDDLINNSDEMWDMIDSRILDIAQVKISKHILGEE